MGMTESDLDQLREFGKKVQIDKKKGSTIKKWSFKKTMKLILVRFIKISSMLFSHIQRFFHSFIDFVDTIFISLQHNVFDGFLFKTRFKNKVDSENKRVNDFNDSYVLVEYQRQFLNTSIIIRRRKKKETLSIDPSIPVPPSKAIAFYFHRIDAQDAEKKNNFSPRSSLWDFTYETRDNILVQLNHFFRK